MKIYLLLLSNLLCVSFVLGHSSRVCQDYIIPVNITSLVYTAIYPPFQDNYDVVGFVNNLARRDTNATAPTFSCATSVSAEYNIGATFCTPKSGANEEKTVLLATHGLKYDRRQNAKTWQYSQTADNSSDTGTQGSSPQTKAL